MENRFNLGEYFIAGFTLANKCIDLLLLNFLLYFPSFFFTDNSSEINWRYFLFSSLIGLLYISFNLSVPKFLVSKQENKTMLFRNMLSLVLINTFRLILPGFLFIFFFLLMLIPFVIFVPYTPAQYEIFLGNINRYLYPLSYLIVI